MEFCSINPAFQLVCVSGVVVGDSWGQLSLTEVGFEVVVSVERHDAEGWVGLDSVIATVPVTQSGECSGACRKPPAVSTKPECLVCRGGEPVTIAIR